MKETTIALLLARGGSKGVPGKNLRHVGGRSLVARSVLAASAAAQVDAIYVSTDDQRIAAEAERFGGRVIVRPEALAGDTATSESGWLHALAEVRRDFPDVSRLVLLQCTSPFTTGADIDECLAQMDAQDAACAVSVVPDHSFLWTFSSDGRGAGINHDEKVQRARRQDLPPAFRENGAIYCVRVDDFERVGRRFCGPVALFVADHPPVEIDTLEDLALCDAIARSRGEIGTPLAADLSAVRAVVMDFDGVHTDDTVQVDQNGTESVSVSRRDGLGIEMLRKSERYRLLILSKERNPVVSRRAEKLGIGCLQATDDKVAALEAWLASEALDWSQVLYIGNDRNDLPVMSKVGFSACPRDAHPSVLAVADWIVPQDGGRGAVRDVAERLLFSDADDTGSAFRNRSRGTRFVVAGNGPSLLAMAPSRIGAGDVIVRVNNFFFEDSYLLGRRVDLVQVGGDRWIFPFYAKTLMRLADAGVYDVRAWSTHQPHVERRGRRMLPFPFVPLTYRDDAARSAIAALIEKHRKTPTTGILAVINAHGLGGQTITLAGIDLYTGRSRYAHMPAGNAAALSRSADTTGYNPRFHDPELDLAILKYLAERPDITLYRAADTETALDFLPLAPELASGIKPEAKREQTRDWQSWVGLWPIGAMRLARKANEIRHDARAFLVKARTGQR